MSIIELLARLLLLLAGADPVPTAVPEAAAVPEGVDKGLGAFTWAQVITLSGAVIAASAVILTLLVNAARTRHET